MARFARHTCGFTGSIRVVLPVALLYTPQDLVSAAGGLAAAIAMGGLAGAAVLIGLFLVSMNGS